MINATAARDIALQSESAINLVVEEIGKKIEEAALLGKRELDLESAMNYDKRFEPTKNVAFRNPEFTTWQRLVVNRLKKEGFQVGIAIKVVQIGGGLGSMDDAVRDEQQPFIQVRW
jgi:hypothetical protein